MTPGQTAITELRQKSLQQIQRDTTIRWMQRGIAAQALGLHPIEVDEYFHEAIEHASLTRDAELLATVRRALVYDASRAPRPDVLKELKENSLQQIQEQTGLTWAWRAHAALHLFVEAARRRQDSNLDDDAIVYALEAEEHAALSGNDHVLQTVRQIIDDARAWALSQMGACGRR